MQQGAGFPRIGVSRSFPGASIVGVASVYAFGLGSRWDCEVGWQVGHGGGFPGFGSIMVWLPEHGVGVFAMANLTYASPGSLAQEMLRTLHRSGGLEPREAVPSRALTEASERIARLVDQWGDREAERKGPHESEAPREYELHTLSVDVRRNTGPRVSQPGSPFRKEREHQRDNGRARGYAEHDVRR